MNPVRWMNRSWFVARRLRHSVAGPRVVSQEQWLVAEGGWKLFARVHAPPGVDGPVPAVLLVPGLGAPGSALEGFREPLNAAEVVGLGAVAMTLDLSGRGKSWGVDTFGGPEHHADVRVALRHLASRHEVDASRIGVVSFSLGCAAVAGALASPTCPPVAWWVDWEGPCDREIITSGGRMMDPAMGHAMEDDTYWRPREAVRHVGQIGCPYLRYQSRADHAQPGELRHAERMIRAASAGQLPWFQLNDHARGAVPEAAVWPPGGYRHAREWLREQIRLLHDLP
jgi:dienelactone hydrolase